MPVAVSSTSRAEPTAMGLACCGRIELVGIFLLLGCASFLPAGAVAVAESVIRLPSSREEVFSVDDFGAAGDGLTDDTKAFEDAWRVACSYSSKVVLEFPMGKKYLVWPISLNGPCQSKVTLRISGTIVAPDDPAIWDQFDSSKWLYFRNISHLTVKGGGMINGMGDKWWDQSCKRNKSIICHHAPTAIMFHKCMNLRIQNMNLLNSQQTHISFNGCSRVKVSSLEVIAPADSPNTDGIHISLSTSVIIRDSIIRTGDDCISIVSQSSHVRIKNIICGPGHGISIGSLGKSNGWDEVHDVIVDSAHITTASNGVRIKTWQGGRGFVHGVTFQNILMTNVSNPIIIDQYYCDASSCRNQTDALKVSGISYMRISGTSATEEAIKFLCSDTYACEDIFLEDVQLLQESGEEAAAYCWNAAGFSYGTVVPSSCLSDSGLSSIKQS